MASVPCSDISYSVLCKSRAISLVGLSSFPLSEPKAGALPYLSRDRVISQGILRKGTLPYIRRGLHGFVTKKVTTIPRSNISSNSSDGSGDDSSNQDKTPFGYTRKDVLLIGLGVTLFGIGLKSGLEFFGVDPLQAGNVVQLVLVLGLTVGWISTYIFRVSNKEMTYAQQLRDYESKVMEKRLESLTEAELQALLEQVEEEKSQPTQGEQST
ncbi:uncharacterized protein LOC113767813 [Coffea eugenioides]|uniref:uncharacterized protein LOC113767813 n=1 Tax=Coffea eugenioides TaxID=49369 RepID=UPI000F6045E0|nr:uncharacterized protein LOC113767813 [Coffea eugenioides]